MTEKTYAIKPVKEEDTDAVMELLQRTFFIDEPMNEAVELYTDGKCDQLEQFCISAMKESSMSFKAVNKEGDIIGVMVSGIRKLKDDDDSHNYLTMAEKCKNPKFQKILYVLAQREAGGKIWEKYPDDEFLVDVHIAATDPNWRKLGIMNELLSATEKKTTQERIRILRMDTSSAYSAMSAEKLGFTCIYSAAYLDIKMNGVPIIIPKPPHVNDRIYVKLMNLEKY